MLVQHFYPNVKETYVSVPGFTGNFEVYINNRLIHSKKRGQGFVVDPEKFMKKVMKAVEE